MATVNFSTSRQYLNDEASFREALNKLVAANSLSVNAQGNLVPAGFFKDLFNGSVSTNRRLVEFKIMEFLVQGKKWLKPDDIKLVEQLAGKVGLFMKKMDSGNRHKELRSLINLIVKEILQYKSVAPKDYTKLCQDFQARYRRILSPYSEQCEQIKRTFAEVFKFQTDKGTGLERLVGDKIPFVGILNNKSASDPAAPGRPAGNAMNPSAEKMMRVAKGALATILSAAGVSTAYYTYQNWDSIHIPILKPDFPVENSSMGYLGMAALGISAFALLGFKARGGDLGQLASNIKTADLKFISNTIVTNGMTRIAQIKDGLEGRYHQFRNGNNQKSSKDNERGKENSFSTQSETPRDGGLDNQNQVLMDRLQLSDPDNQDQTKTLDTSTGKKGRKDPEQFLEEIKKAVAGMCDRNLTEGDPEIVIFIVQNIDRLAKFCFATINAKNVKTDRSLFEKLKNIVNELSIEFKKLRNIKFSTNTSSSIDNESPKIDESLSIDNEAVKQRSRRFLNFSSYENRNKVSVLMDILLFRLEALNFSLTGDDEAKEKIDIVLQDIKVLLKNRRDPKEHPKDAENIFKKFPLDELYILQKLYDLKELDKITENNLYQLLSRTPSYEEKPKGLFQKFQIYAKEFYGWSTLFNFNEGSEIKKNLDKTILLKENPEFVDEDQVEIQSNSQLEFSSSNSASQEFQLTNSSSSNSQNFSFSREEKVVDKPDVIRVFQNRERLNYNNL